VGNKIFVTILGYGRCYLLKLYYAFV